MKYLSVKNISKRLKSESPTFFRKIMQVCLALAASGTAIIALKEVPSTAKYILFLPDNIAGYLLLAGVVGGFIAKMTVTSSDAGTVK